MDDIWPQIFYLVNKSTKVSIRLTCKKFNHLLPRNKSKAMFYRYQCIRDGNSHLASDYNQPLITKYYKAAIKANDIKTVQLLLDNRIKVNYVYLCIELDRVEIFRLLYRDEPSESYYFTGKTWVDEIIPPYRFKETIYAAINYYGLFGMISDVTRTSCVQSGNTVNFLPLMRNAGYITSHDVKQIVLSRRADMYKICINEIDDFVVKDKHIAYIDDIRLLKYANNMDQVMKYSVMYGSKNIPYEENIVPDRNMVKYALKNLDYDKIKYYWENYSEVFNAVDCPIFYNRDRTLTLELWNLMNEINPLLFNSTLHFITKVADEVILDQNFIDNFPKNSCLLGSILQSEEICRKYVGKGHKFTKNELSVLLTKKFVVDDEFIEFLYANSQTYKESEVNYPVTRWLYKKGMIKNVSHNLKEWVTN